MEDLQPEVFSLARCKSKAIEKGNRAATVARRRRRIDSGAVVGRIRFLLQYRYVAVEGAKIKDTNKKGVERWGAIGPLARSLVVF